MAMNQKDEHEMKSNQQSSEGRIIFCIHSNKAHVQVYLRAVRLGPAEKHLPIERDEPYKDCCNFYKKIER